MAGDNAVVIGVPDQVVQSISGSSATGAISDVTPVGQDTNQTEGERTIVDAGNQGLNLVKTAQGPTDKTPTQGGNVSEPVQEHTNRVYFPSSETALRSQRFREQSTPSIHFGAQVEPKQVDPHRRKKSNLLSREVSMIRKSLGNRIQHKDAYKIDRKERSRMNKLWQFMKLS